jgi:hypothetical protein
VITETFLKLQKRMGIATIAARKATADAATKREVGFADSGH